MQLIEWEVNEDGYEEQIIIPKEQRDLAAEEWIGTENKQKVAVRILCPYFPFILSRTRNLSIQH